MEDRNHDLIIMGQGPSRTDCPFDTKVWASLSVLSHEGFEDKPYDKLFCFDIPTFKPDEKKGLEIAQARGIPIVSCNPFQFVTEPYPSKEICERFRTNLMKNDTSFMISYALYKGFKSLLLCGIDQTIDPYKKNKPYTTYWLGIATGMGVDWAVTRNCRLWRF